MAAKSWDLVNIWCQLGSQTLLFGIIRPRAMRPLTRLVDPTQPLLRHLEHLASFRLLKQLPFAKR